VNLFTGEKSSFVFEPILILNEALGFGLWALKAEINKDVEKKYFEE
jgi:hypothetical protein